MENRQNITKAKNDNFEKREKLAPQNLESQNITKAKNDSFEKREKLAPQNFESQKITPSLLSKIMKGSAVECPKPSQKKRHRWMKFESVIGGAPPGLDGIYESATQEKGQQALKWRVKSPMEQNLTRQINEVDAEGLTSLSAIKFHVAVVSKPLAAAVRVAKAGNIIVMHPDEDKCFIQNISTRERMKLREKRETYVFDVVCEENKERGEVTLDSGAGVSVWP